MAVSRIKTWVPGDVLSASDLNAEFDNQNGTGVAFPLTENVSCAGYEVSNAKLTTLKQLNDNVVSIDNYADFATAISSIGSTVTTLLINKNVNVTANATVPSTLTLWFMGQGKLTITAATTTTINGPVVADDRQIFAGSGTVAGLAGTLAVSPYWWGTVSSGILNLYVATTGSDSNDGMTVGTPLATVQAAGNKLYTFAYADLTYKINIAAGTYTETVSFLKAFPTPQRVQLLGVAVADGTTPTTILDSPGGSDKIGIYLQNKVRMQIEDIKFTDYRDGGAVSYSGGGKAIIADEQTELYCRNVFINACDWGIYVASNSRLRYQAGIIDACAVGAAAIFHSTYTMGYGGSAADITGATGTAIINNTVIGLQVQENSTGHCDYCYLGSNGTGVLATVSSRCHAVSSTFISNTYAFQGQFNSNFYDTSCTFTTNTTDVILNSGSRRGGATALDESDMFGPSLFESDTAGAATQSASPVTVYTKTFKAKEFQNRGAGFTLRLYGEVVGTADTKTVTVTLGATTLLTATVAASTTDYWIEINVINRTAASSQKCLTKFLQNGVAPAIAMNVSVAEDLTASKTLTVTHQVTNVADLNRIGWVELEVVH